VYSLFYIFLSNSSSSNSSSGSISFVVLLNVFISTHKFSILSILLLILLGGRGGVSKQLSGSLLSAARLNHGRKPQTPFSEVKQFVT